MSLTKELGQLRKLGKAALRANTDAGFKYLQLCEPVLVLSMIAALRDLATVPVSDLDRIAPLATAALGKRAISDEGLAFAEACDPALICQWCQALGATT